MKKAYTLFTGLAALVATASMAYAAVSAALPELNAPMRADAEQVYFDIPAETINVAYGVYAGGARAENTTSETPNVGNVKDGATATYYLNVTEESGYNVEFNFYRDWGNYADFSFTITDEATNTVEASTVYKFTGKGEYTIPLTGVVTTGKKTLKIVVGNVVKNGTSDYITNWYNFTLSKQENATAIPSGYTLIPGTVSVEGGSYSSPDRMLEGAGTASPNVGNTTEGCWAEYKLYAEVEGGYAANIAFYWSKGNEADIIFTLTDEETQKTEAKTIYHFDGVAQTAAVNIPLEGRVTVGKKVLRMEISNVIVKPGNNSYVTNWRDFLITYTGADAEPLPDIPAGIDEIPGTLQLSRGTYSNCRLEDAGNVGYVVNGSKAVYDVYSTSEGIYKLNLEVSSFYSNSTFTFTVKNSQGEVEATARKTITAGGTNEVILSGLIGKGPRELVVEVSDVAGSFALNWTAISLEKLDYDPAKALNIESAKLGREVLADDIISQLNAEGEATISGAVFTALSDLTVTFPYGEQTVKPVLDGLTAGYSFLVTALDGSEKSFTLTASDFHIYEATEADKTMTVRFDAACKGDNSTWSNGLFTIYPTNDGWGGTQFKFGSGNNRTVHIDVPSYMLVKEIILGGLKDNYQPGRINSVTSGDATVWMPSASSFVNGDGVEYDLVCVVENHVAGTGFDVTFEDGGQPVWWWDFVYEEVAPTDLVPTAVACSTSGSNTVVRFSFDRVVENTQGYVNGELTDAYSHGTSFLYVPLWNLAADTEYTVTIPKGTLHDANGVSNSEPLVYTFTTGSAPEAPEAMADERFIVVRDVEGLKAAVEGLAATNKTADSPLSMVYILNGDYDLGSDVETDRYNYGLQIKGVYNVAFVGESRDGVVFHGTRTGITSPIISGEGSVLYWQNLTIRNDFDWGVDTQGVAVAYAGGSLDVMENVVLQSQQDTFVTGARGYYRDCTIYGKTDYICGGGDHFFDGCHLVMTAAGGVITAPETSSAEVHGYVFSGCDISGEAGYDLGRPWHNEPRAFWLNTTMKSQSSEGGWRGMSNLVTHFFEYGTVDADGKQVDLSKRVNSSTSVNTYSPILPEQYVPYFTARNVLGYKDAFDAEAYRVGAGTPENVYLYADGNLSWDYVPGAVRYIVRYNGEYLCSLTDNVAYAAQLEEAIAAGSAAKVAARAAGNEYRVVAVNALGQSGEASDANSYIATGVDAVEAAADTDAVYYNLQGVRVDKPAAGLYIRRQGRNVSKVFVK